MSFTDEICRNRITAVLQAICTAKYLREDPDPCEIEPGLYLGSVGAAYNMDALKKVNVTHVLVVAKSLDPGFPNDFVYKKIDVLDSPDTNLAQHFDECFEFIEQCKNAGGCVLVHCFAGRSRSVTVVVAYLMKKHQMRFNDALELVRSKRPQICPNPGFQNQLENYQKSLEVMQVSTPDESVRN